MADPQCGVKTRISLEFEETDGIITDLNFVCSIMFCVMVTAFTGVGFFAFCRVSL